MGQTTPLLRRVQQLSLANDRCVTANALRAEGLSLGVIRSLERRGAISRALWGVYVVGEDVLSTRQAMRAALLSGGSDSMLAGRTAAEHRALITTAQEPLDIIIRARRHPRTVTTLLPIEATGRPVEVRFRSDQAAGAPELVDGLQTAQVADALCDLAASEGGEIALRAWREADFRRLLEATSIERVSRSGRPGHTIIRELVESMPIVHDETTKAQTASEFALIEALLRLGVPRPRSNMPMQLDASWYFPDLWWHLWRAVIEVDGPIHRRPRRAAEDRLRDRHMEAHGISVLRVDRDAVLDDADREARAARAWLAGLGCLGLTRAA